MVILCIILYGMVEVFRWGMMDLAERRYDHDAQLVTGTTAAEQLTTKFHIMRPIDAIFFQSNH